MKNRQGRICIMGMVAAAFLFCGCATPEYKLAWNKKFTSRLPEMGKNNWIVISDAAYPAERADGIETIATNKPLTSVLDYVLSSMDKAGHAGATAWISAELEKIPDRDAIGIEDIYQEIWRQLNEAKITTKTALEQDILKMVETQGADYRILVLKSNTRLPYTTVYLQLDCRYWDETREKRLRDAIRTAE